MLRGLFTFCAAAYNRPMTDPTPMTPDQVREAIHLAVILHIEKLPQLKGKGQERGRRESGIRFFANAVADQIMLGNIRLMRGPPLEAHSVGNGK